MILILLIGLCEILVNLLPLDILSKVVALVLLCILSYYAGKWTK